MNVSLPAGGAPIRFKGGWEVDTSVLRDYGPEMYRDIEQAFQPHDEEIRELPDSVTLRYNSFKPSLSPPDISIGMNAGAAHGEYCVEIIKRGANGWKFWQNEPLEKFVARAVEKAKALSSEWEAE